jgi:hypothetical protein
LVRLGAAAGEDDPAASRQAYGRTDLIARLLDRLARGAAGAMDG